MAKKDDDFNFEDADFIENEEDEETEESDLDRDDDGYLDEYSPSEFDEDGNPIEDEYDENGYPIEEDKEEDEDLSLEDAKDLADNIEQQTKGSKNDEILEYNRQHMGDTNATLKKLDINDVKLDTKTSGKLASKGAGKAGVKAGGKAAGAGLKALLSNPYFWLVVGIILAIVLIVILIIVIINAIQAPFSNIDIENGKFDTSDGIRGDRFYGARIISYDEDLAFNELQKYYIYLSADLLFRIDTLDGINFNAGLVTPNPDDLNNESYTAGLEKKLATALLVEIVETMDGLDVELSLNYDETLTEEKNDLIATSIHAIDHFGYTTNELNSVKTALKNYINANKNNIFTIDASYIGNFENDIDRIFSENYSDLNVVSPKYFVQDVILSSGSTMISGLPAKNFVACIYMPNSSVTLEDTEYLFYIADENIKVNYEIKYANGENETIYSSGEANSSWYDGVGSETAEAEDIDINLQTFKSIFSDNLLLLENNTSIYSLLLNANNHYTDIDYTTLNQLFKTNEVTTEDGDSYTEISYLPALDNEYYYLTFNSNGIFNFCEFSVDYE